MINIKQTALMDLIKLIHFDGMIYDINNNGYIIEFWCSTLDEDILRLPMRFNSSTKHLELLNSQYYEIYSKCDYQIKNNFREYMQDSFKIEINNIINGLEKYE